MTIDLDTVRAEHIASLTVTIERLRAELSSAIAENASLREWAKSDDDAAENLRLRADKAKLREALADMANQISIVGSPFDRLQIAANEMMLDVKRRARTALKETNDGE